MVKSIPTKNVIAALTILTLLSLTVWKIVGDTKNVRYTPSVVQVRDKARYTPSEVEVRDKARYTPSEVQVRDKARYTPSEVQVRDKTRYTPSEVEVRDKARYTPSEVEVRAKTRYILPEVTSGESIVKIKADFKEPHEVGNCLTVNCNYGRLGNQMFSFAVLYGLSKLNKRTVCAAPCLLNWFEKIFKISTPKNRSPSWHQRIAFEIGNYLNPETDNKIPQKANIIVGSYTESYTFFHFVQSEIREEFTFQAHLVEHAQDTLRRAALKGPESVFVGVHVRRGDFTWFLPLINTRLAGVDFYKKAMDIFRRRYSAAVFVVVSDDMDWCRSNLAESDVFIHNLKLPAEYDLALLAHCNHSIFSESTFGFWGAYLAGGQTIYLANVTVPGTWYNIYRPQNKFYLPDWLGIEDTSKTRWANYEENNLLYHVNEALSPLKQIFLKMF